jgi:hypothetical protein
MISSGRRTVTLTRGRGTSAFGHKSEPTVSAQYEAVKAYLKKVGIDIVIKVIEHGAPE